MTDELRIVGRLAARFGPLIGDDCAVVDGLLLAIDPVVEGVHFDTRAAARDIGWNAVARNVSDLAAMGGRPRHGLVSLLVPRACEWDPEQVLDGVAEAAAAHGLVIAGGDISSGPALVVTVAVTGAVDDGDPVLRSGARPADLVFVTGPLGEHPTRIRARLAEGEAARRAGATAMIDVSDGLPLDLRRLASASGVGMELDAIPVAESGEWDDGDSYELAFTAPDPAAVYAGFEAAGLEPPFEIGTCTAEPDLLLLNGEDLPEGGWVHYF